MIPKGLKAEKGKRSRKGKKIIIIKEMKHLKTPEAKGARSAHAGGWAGI